MSYITYHEELEQGSEEWHNLRCGLLTASEIKLILTTKTLKYSTSDKAKLHAYEIAAQRISNYVEPQYINDAMLRGHEDEIKARMLYNDKYMPVEEVGFITNNKWGFTLGFSPDGLTRDKKSGIEIKSRIQKHHVKTVSSNEMPDDFMLQVQAGMLIAELEFIDYISYSGGLHMFVKPIEPNLEVQEAIVEACHEFENTVSEIIDNYKNNSGLLFETERNIEEEIVI